MNIWKPWRQLILTPEATMLQEPPCRYCEHWKPQPRGVSGSVDLCDAELQFRDFSCFDERKS